MSRLLCLSCPLSLSLSFSFSLSSVVLCSLVEPNKCVRYATGQPLEAPTRPAPTPEPPLSERLEVETHKLDPTVEQPACWHLPTVPGSASHASDEESAAPQSPGEPIAEAGRCMEAVSMSIQASEAGRAVEAEGYVFEAHMLRGLELEAMRQKAEHSWNRALGALGGAEEPSRAERMEQRQRARPRRLPASL